MPASISVQLYSLRDQAQKDFASVLKRLSSDGFVGVELAGLHGMKPKDFLKLTDGLGLKISSAHTGMPEGDKANEIMDEQQELGNKTLITGFGENEFRTEVELKKTIERFSAAAALLRKRGMRLGIHNHWWEFEFKFNGKTAHEIFMEEVDPEVFAEVDIYWVATAGGDPSAVLRKLGKRCPLVHVKDGPCEQGKSMMAVGKGKVDVKAALKASPESAEWHVVELDQCDTDMHQAVSESYTFLTTNGLSKGRK